MGLPIKRLARTKSRLKNVKELTRSWVVELEKSS
jgi:hypothetical protein